MLGHRDMSLDDYLGILRRHIWVIIVPTIFLPILAYGVSLLLPNRYVSQTLVLVEQQKVPESLVKSVVTDQLNDRLATMQQQILSRTRLEPIIERFGLYKEEREKKVPMEDLIGQMQKAITITPVRPVVTARQGELPGFTISFQAENPRLAQQVCAEITSMFIEENLRLREQRAQGTTDFLQKQVEEAKKKLDEKDSKLAEFKRRYIGQLPGQEQTNMNILMGLTTQLESVSQLLTRTAQDKAYTESLLNQQVAAWQASQSGNNPQALDLQLAQLQSQLVTMEARYTADHPDVIKMKADIAQLKRKIEESAVATKEQAPDKSALARLAEPPQIQQLRNQIYQYQITIKEKTRDQERLQEQIKTYRSRVELSPLVEQQFKDIMRDYTTAQEFYDDLLRKLSQSGVAADLERRQQAEQFRVMDPPNLPEKPTFPNRMLFAAGGFGGGLCLGFGLALLLELKDKSIRSDRDIEVLLQLPTLAMIPAVDAKAAKKGLLGRARGMDDHALPRAEV